MQQKSKYNLLRNIEFWQDNADGGIWRGKLHNFPEENFSHPNKYKMLVEMINFLVRKCQQHNITTFKGIPHDEK